MESTTSTSSRTRRLLLPMAAIAVAGGLAIGSGASFTSQTSSAPSVVTAGAFTHTNSVTDQAVFSMPSALPGDTAEGTAVVTNNGDFAGAFTLSADNTEGSVQFPEGTLILTVVDSAAPEAPIYQGDLAAFNEVPLGEIEAGDSRTYSFDVAFDESAGNETQGASVSAVYTWDAIQVASDIPEG